MDFSRTSKPAEYAFRKLKLFRSLYFRWEEGEQNLDKYNLMTVMGFKLSFGMYSEIKTEPMTALTSLCSNYIVAHFG